MVLLEDKKFDFILEYSVFVKSSSLSTTYFESFVRNVFKVSGSRQSINLVSLEIIISRMIMTFFSFIRAYLSTIL